MGEPNWGPSWGEMYPDGRDIFYEGDDPEGFAAAMVDQFGFNPSTSPSWREWRGFRCPGEHMDEVYGSGKWVLGS